MNKRQIESLKKRQRIIEAASLCFAANGYDNTIVATIAKQANVSKGLVFALFGSKQALFETVLKDTLTAWSEDSLKRRQREIVDPAKDLEEMFRSSFDFVQVRPLLLRLMLGQEPILQEYLEVIHKVNQQWRLHIQQVIRLGMEEKVFRSNLDVRGTADVFHQLQYSYLERLYAGGVKENANKRLDIVVDIFMSGILAR